MNQEKLKIEYVNPEDLKASEYNPRKWSKKEERDLTNSIEEAGLVDPLIVNSAPARKNILIGGHFRLKIANALGFKTVPVIYLNVPDLKAEQKLNLRLNKNKGVFDMELLSNMDEELLINVGFEPRELDDIYGIEKGQGDPDDIPEVQEEGPARSKPGDKYRLGAHVLMCGDSTKAADVEALTGKAKMDMVFTDPPYNVNYSGRGKKTASKINNDNLTVEVFGKFVDLLFKNMATTMRPGAVFYICSRWSSYPTFYEALVKNGFYRAGVIIWVKNSASMGWNDFRYKHEWIIVGKKKRKKVTGVPIFYGWKKGTHYFRDTRDECDVWEVPKKHSGNYKHPTEKPVWLIEKALAGSSERGGNVLDICGGSGSTLIACERLSRKCYTMENDPHYVDVILERWESFTGKKAVKINA